MPRREVCSVVDLAVLSSWQVFLERGEVVVRELWLAERIARRLVHLMRVGGVPVGGVWVCPEGHGWVVRRVALGFRPARGFVLSP